MALIRPFVALRPPADRVEEVACVPYDVINTKEALELSEGKPASFLHVIRPEIDLEPGINLYDDAVYAKGRENLDKFQAEGHLIEDSEPGIYIYQLQWKGHTQTGILACCSAEEYDQDLIKKHEKTRQVKEDDRTRHVMTHSAHAEPVFLTFRPQEAIRKAISTVTKNEPIYNFKAVDEVQHTLWKLSETRSLVELFKQVPALYVADGHHRSASASRTASAMKEKNPNHTGNEEYNFFLAGLFPSDEMLILPYNRVVRDLNGMNPQEALDKLKNILTYQGAGDGTPQTSGQVHVYLEQAWHHFSIPESLQKEAKPSDNLDVAVLQKQVLTPVFGIGDPRQDERIDFVGGIRGFQELEKVVNSGEFAIAFSMFPTQIEEVLSVADAGGIMPPKSTWFEPKLRSGLVVHQF